MERISVWRRNFYGTQAEVGYLKEIVIEPEETISWPRSETG